MRRVVVTRQLFEILDSLLPASRGGDRPSRDDFIRLELLPARDYFADHWDDGTLLPNPAHPAYKTLIAAGELAPAFTITGRLLPDGTIELIDVSIDFEMGQLDPPED